MHPDKGGSHDDMARINAAYASIRSERDRTAYISRMGMMGTTCDKCRGKGFIPQRRGFAMTAREPCEACGGLGLLLL